MSHLSTNSPIDAVITWVDGSDPVHRAKRMAALKEKPGKGDIPIAAGRDETRFKDNGELKYCIASIKKFAPWIRNIFIITDNQVPQFLTQKMMRKLSIKIVDHKEIFESYEWALPTFNSYSIETSIINIKSLSSHFIYFNDDFMLTEAVFPGNFFQGEKVVLRGAWKGTKKINNITILINKLINLMVKKLLGITRTLYLLSQMRSASLVGSNRKYFRSPHVPHPVRKQTLELYFNKYPEVFIQNIKYPFRDINQFWPISLANHIEIADNNAIFKDEDLVRMISGERDSQRKIRQTLLDIQEGKVKYLCLGSLEKINPQLRKELDEILSALIEK